MVKRIFDLILGLIGLILSMPLWCIFALAIWFEDRNGIFYLQDRVGQGGKIFKSIKFRSMICNAERKTGPIQAMENDKRVTRIGKLLRAAAMDELPQLLNILKGDMSFIGPRALRAIEKDNTDSMAKSMWEFEGFKERVMVKPGLTGVAQIFAPRDISRVEKFKYDIWYMKNQNFFLDIYLIFLSFLISFEHKWEIKGDKVIFLGKRLKDKIEQEIKEDYS